MATTRRLFFHEEIMLLALRDEAGTIVSGSTFPYAIGGALLAELLMNGRITVDGSKKMLVNVVSSGPMHDPMLDECLEKMRASKRRGSLKTWVTRLSRIRNLKHRVAERLCHRGIVRADEDKVLLIFNRRIYPEVDPAPERELIARMRAAILTETREVDPRTAIIVSIANSAGLLKVLFDKKELRKRKKRIEKIARGEMVGEATRSAIEAMQAAVAVCIVVGIAVTGD